MHETTLLSRPFRSLIPGALGALTAALLAPALLPTAAAARDDVPEELLTKKNPVALEESELRYYTRQYKTKCSRCHGIDGTGKGKESVAEGAVPPRDFTDAAYMSQRSDGQLYYQVVAGGGERCAMPAFGPESDHAWKEDKIWHMVAFIRRFAEADAADTP